MAKSVNSKRTTKPSRAAKSASKSRGLKPARPPVSKSAPPKPKSGASALADRRQRAGEILAELKRLYPDATCALHHRSALELLVATILSAQCTDETVNKVVPVLFGKYPSAQALAAADPADIETIIHSCGFFRQKTKSIIGTCRQLVETCGGEVPDTMDALTQLPGVARKTANVLLGTWFGKNDGVVVDTHIGRLAHRLDLTWTSKDEKDAVKIEQDLMQVLPQAEWTFTGHALIWHGRRVCPARKPKCDVCTLNKLCPSAFAFAENGKEQEPPRGKKQT